LSEQYVVFNTTPGRYRNETFLNDMMFNAKLLDQGGNILFFLIPMLDYINGEIKDSISDYLQKQIDNLIIAFAIFIFALLCALVFSM
jgi:hypothetical protein